MKRKLGLGAIWLTLVVYAIASAQFKTQQGDFELIIALSTGDWNGVNPIIIGIFMLMGILPLVYGAFILFDSEQKISPYPFFLVSFGVGAFALLPYLALRSPDTVWNGEKNWLLKILDSRFTAIVSTVAIAVLLVVGLMLGDWSDYVTQWQTSQFIHIMSIDFCLLSLLFPSILQDDMQRRGVNADRWFLPVAFVPLFGSLIYWCLRPQLPETAISAESTASS